MAGNSEGYVAQTAKGSVKGEEMADSEDEVAGSIISHPRTTRSKPAIVTDLTSPMGKSIRY